MKTHCGLLLVAAALFAGGCGKEQNSSTPPAAATKPASAPAGYLGAMARGQQQAVKTVDITSLNENIQLFNVQEGRNPTDLNELVAKHNLGALPAPPVGMKFVYDANQGKVTLAPQ